MESNCKVSVQLAYPQKYFEFKRTSASRCGGKDIVVVLHWICKALFHFCIQMWVLSCLFPLLIREVVRSKAHFWQEESNTVALVWKKYPSLALHHRHKKKQFTNIYGDINVLADAQPKSHSQKCLKVIKWWLKSNICNSFNKVKHIKGHAKNKILLNLLALLTSHTQTHLHQRTKWKYTYNLQVCKRS